MDISELKALAAQGDVQAIADLACEYLNGENVEHNPEKGAMLMEKAANAGHALAALNMSCIYRDGDGVKQSYQKAEEWAVKAAELGEPDELESIAQYYILGDYMDDNPYKADHVKAFKYFQICSNAGSADSTVQLGNCYEYGWGTRINIDTAKMYYKKAAEAGSKIGFDNYARTAINGHNRDDIEENISLIIRFSEAGNATAQNLLADAYYFGYGVEMSDETSWCWREKAAENGNGAAQCHVAEWYANGWNGKPVDEDKAEELYCAAAEQGIILAKLCAANYLIKHTSSPKDQDKAIAYYTELSESGIESDTITDAQLYLGVCYIQGSGVPKDLDLAEKWLSASAKNGQKLAQKILADMYSKTGQENKALFWYERIAASGDEEARNSILSSLVDIYMTSGQYSKAFSIAQEQVNKGIGGSQPVYILGMCYAYGLGIEENSQQALYWFRKATDAGHKGAESELISLTDKIRSTTNSQKSKSWFGKLFG